MAPAARDAVVRMLSFAPADVTRQADISRVIGGDHPDTLVYLALPPGLLPSVMPALAAAKLRAADAVAIENSSGPAWPQRSTLTRSRASSCPSR